ncbi:MAG TPA: glycosyltransferase family 2 protein [Opitutaceae bacterium]|nr:glycosyltransferase family 2 protein [Lacunisphaera sp.]HWA10480.1 glycosyltransferase family 2 protein [Opitutaceae bacterium]
MPSSDVVIVPVHNRREITLACLRALHADGVEDWAEILVVDDGSTDGTGEAVAREFPSVSVLRGDGSWWWAGAIRRGMERTLARGAERIFWLNDDCRPPRGALRALRDLVQRTGGVAWIDARAPGGWSYGGHRRGAWGLRRCTPEEERAGKVETFSGNCACLPRAWIERAGLPHDHLFPHGIADLDYGLRLHAAGAPLQALPGVVADNADPSRSSSESWLSSPRPMREIWADFASPKSFLHFPAWRRFSLRHWGPVWGWAVYAAPYARWAGIAVVRTFTSPAARARIRPRVSSPSGPEKDRG